MDRAIGRRLRRLLVRHALQLAFVSTVAMSMAERASAFSFSACPRRSADAFRARRYGTGIEPAYSRCTALRVYMTASEGPPTAMSLLGAKSTSSAAAPIVFGSQGNPADPLKRKSESAVSKSTPQAGFVKVATFFFFWYSFNVGYNLSTKFTLNVLPLPLMLAALQLAVGVPYVWMLWLTGIRRAPRLSLRQVKQAVPVASAHTMAHIAAVVSIGAGAVGFVQVVKGAEPLFTAALSFVTGSAMPWPVYLTLIPVIGGVGMASAGEISFSVLAFAAAMTSNASAASRSVLGKQFMHRHTEPDSRLDAGNLYAIMTMLGCIVLCPAALMMEGSKVAGVWNAALNAGHHPTSLIRNGLLSGLFFYMYNEVSFYALNAIHPVTHALGNAFKRVVMIIVSVLVLNHKFTPLGLMGCCTAIGGVMLYSVAKAKLRTTAPQLDEDAAATATNVDTNIAAGKRAKGVEVSKVGQETPGSCLDDQTLN